MSKRLPTGEEIRAVAHERVKVAVAKQARAKPVAAKKKAKTPMRRPRASA